jgi:hypothetical protein
MLPLMTGMTLLPVGAQLVTVEYQALANTVTNQPFGSVVPRLTPVWGYFTYNSNTPDLSPADQMRGKFEPVVNWQFRAEFLDKVITGSGQATATTNLFGSPTLAFNDGGNRQGRGIMRINGNPDATIEFGLSIAGQSKDLPTDKLPLNFTFNPPPGGAVHTFVLKDQSGSMLLGFTSFQGVRPKILSFQRTANQVEIVWSSLMGKPYALEFSTNLANWTVIRNDLVGISPSTSVVDDLALRYPVAIPAKGFYRILERTTSP